MGPGVAGFVNDMDMMGRTLDRKRRKYGKPDEPLVFAILPMSSFSGPLAIVPCADSLHALRIETGRFTEAWTSDSSGIVSIIAGNSVFAITRDGALDQLSLDDGHTIGSTDVGSGSSSFPAPAADGDTLPVPAGDKLVFSI